MLADCTVPPALPDPAGPQPLSDSGSRDTSETAAATAAVTSKQRVAARAEPKLTGGTEW